MTVCAPPACSTCRGQKRALGLLKLEFYVVVSDPIPGVGSSGRAASAFPCWAVSLAQQCTLLMRAINVEIKVQNATKYF